MELKINDRLSLDLEAEHKNVKISNIILDNEVYSMYGGRRDMGSFASYIDTKVAMQAQKDYIEFSRTNVDNFNFYKEKIYPSFRSKERIGMSYLTDTYLEISTAQIFNGIILISEHKLYNHYNKKDKYIEYNLLTNEFSGNVFDFLCSCHPFSHSTNKWNLLALEQYNNGTSPRPFKYLMELLKYFENKKTVRLVFEDGKEKKEDRLYINMFSWHENIVKLKHGLTEFNINNKYIKLFNQRS